MPGNRANMTREQAEQFLGQLDAQSAVLAGRIRTGEQVMANLHPERHDADINPRDAALLFLLADRVDNLRGNLAAIRQQTDLVRAAIEDHGKLVGVVPAGAIPRDIPGQFTRHK
jgi:hypothetical protein